MRRRRNAKEIKISLTSHKWGPGGARVDMSENDWMMSKQDLIEKLQNYISNNISVLQSYANQITDLRDLLDEHEMTQVPKGDTEILRQIEKLNAAAASLNGRLGIDISKLSVIDQHVLYGRENLPSKRILSRNPSHYIEDDYYDDEY